MTQNQTPPEASTKPAKAPRIEQNGVSRPADGTSTGRIWAIADSVSAASGKPASRADVLKAAEAEGINVTTAATQFGRWCKFNCVKATPKPKVEKVAKVKKEKAAKAAPAAVPAAAPVAS